MSVLRLRAAALAAVAGLSACTSYDDYGYGYGGVSVGYGSGYCDPYYDDCYRGRGYHGDPWYGWNDDYYYPGVGFYIYDRSGGRYRWNDDHRRYWEGRRGGWGERNWNDRRWERWENFRGDRREWREDRGEIRDDYRQDRRQDRRELRRENRWDRRD